MTTLTREALKATSEQGTFEVSAGGLVGTARKLRHSQLAEFESWLTDKKGDADRAKLKMYRERLIGMCLLDENGEQMFPGDSWKEIAEFDAAVVKELSRQIEAQCGFASINEAKSVKNSDEGSSETTD